MTADAKVWCSDLMNSRSIKSIDYDCPTPRPKDHWLFKYEKGEFIDPTELPDVLTPRKTMDPPPDIFAIVNRVIVVRERVKTLLDGFRLGRSHLHEVTIKRLGHNEPFEGPFYILNIAEQRSVFVPEQSRYVMRGADGRTTITGARPILDLAIDPKPPEDVDLWMHPNLLWVFFLSAPLAMAIKDAGIASFRLFPCREAA